MDTKRQLSELSSTLTEMKACIIAFSGKPQGTNFSETNSGQEATVSADAGNSFGGCASRRTKTWIAIPLALALFGLMMFIKFYLFTRLGGHNPTRKKIMNNSHIEQVVSSVWQKMGPTRCLPSSHSGRNRKNEYHGRIELDSHPDTTALDRNCVILTYTGKECEVSPYSGEYYSIQHVSVVT